MTSNEAIEQGFIPYPYTFPAIKFEVSNEDGVAICFHGRDVTCDMVSPEHADARGFIFRESEITDWEGAKELN
jgi:hypothetical protein